MGAAKELAKLTPDEQLDVVQEVGATASVAEVKAAVDRRQEVVRPLTKPVSTSRRRGQRELPANACATCGGSGNVNTEEGTTVCPVCDGSGDQSIQVAESVQASEAAAAEGRAFLAEFEGMARRDDVVEEVRAPILERAAARHNAVAMRSTWSRAIGTMRELQRMVDPALLCEALSTQERRETEDTLDALRKWAQEFSNEAAKVTA